VIIFGIIIAIIGFASGITILWTIGMLMIVTGSILVLFGVSGHAVGGREHYY
jgi:hypothetical protein